MITGSAPSLYGLMSAIAQSGECMDCYAIERRLLSLGYTQAEVHEALADARDRAALLAMCQAARTPARELQRMRAESGQAQPAGEA